MKTARKFKSWWLLIVLPVLTQGMCNKDAEDGDRPDADQYVTWKIAGASGSLSVPTDSLDFYYNGVSTAIYGMTKPTPATSFGISFVGAQQSGTFTADYFQVYTGGKYYVPTSTPLQVSVTTYGPTGQYVIGTYSGQVKDSSSSAIIPVAGEFRIKNR